MKNKSVLDILEHLNRPCTYRELVLMLRNVRNESAVCREIKRLIKVEQVVKLKIDIPPNQKLVLYKLDKK